MRRAAEAQRETEDEEDLSDFKDDITASAKSLDFPSISRIY